MKLKEELQKIEEHFQNISTEEFQKNLEDAGYGVIQPTSTFENENQ